MLPCSNLIYLENGFQSLIAELEVISKTSLIFWEKTLPLWHFTVSDVQVPPLLSIIMSLYRTFKGMVPGRLTVFGTMLLIQLMLAPKWLLPLPPCYPKFGVWGFGISFNCICLHGNLFKTGLSDFVTYRGHSVLSAVIFLTMTFRGHVTLMWPLRSSQRAFIFCDLQRSQTLPSASV